MINKIFKKIKSLFVKENKDNGNYYTKPITYSNPYCIAVKNNSNEEKNVVLFDFNLNFNKPNYGNNQDIVITDVFTGTTDGYGRLFAQSATKPFRIGKWRFKSDNEDNLKQNLCLQTTDANGFSQSRPLNLSKLLDENQFIKGIVESKEILNVESTTSIRMKLMPNSQMQITLYPIEINGMLSNFLRNYTKQNWIEKIKSFFKNLTNAN